ncbi:MAG TPA: asparagine synthase (glutamine-hydrolyzing) [Thermoanaerobaculia bacterium]
MCGIAAIVGPDASKSDRLPGMIDALEHRGPDARGVRAVDGCALGHARLRIIDLSSGDQPMTDGGERYWIAYNGEIYNFPEVRDELERRGRAFRTQSDTEVIIAAYDEWGAQCLDRFRGMFSFVLWDTREKALFAARDLFGEKPFYYSLLANGTLIVASEIRAIVASGLVDTALDLHSVDAFLAYGFVPPERTIYGGVASLPPAHRLEWRGGRVSVAAYWTPRWDERRIGMEEAAEELRSLTARAVKRQMIADVPVGAFLSGGLDSSTIVALMQEQSAHPVKTFSVGFGTMINELPYASAVARRYGTEHHEIDLGDIDAAPLLLRMASVYDEPFADTSHIPTYLVARYARDFVKVVLSGDGGDELFGGYGWNEPLRRSMSIGATARLQWILLRTASVALRDRWRWLSDRSLAAGLVARWSDLWTRAKMVHTAIREPERRRLWADGAVESYEPVPYEPGLSVTGLNRSFDFDLRFYLPGDILAKVDRAAMASSLETRAPFLDRDVAEFALSLPAGLKVQDGQLKRVMRAAFSDLWPEEIRHRPKQGFGSPIQQWMRQPAVRDLLESAAAPGSRLRRLLPGLTPHDLGHENYASWILLTLAVWLNVHEVL